MEKAGAAKDALEIIPSKKLKMKEGAEDQEAVYSAMEGFEDEEEEKYIADIKLQRGQMKNNKKRGGYGGRGGRGGKRRRRF